MTGTRRPSLVRVVRPGPHPLDQTPWTRRHQHKRPSWSTWSTRGPEKSWSTPRLTCSDLGWSAWSCLRQVRARVRPRAHARGRTLRWSKIRNPRKEPEMKTREKWDPNIGEKIGPAWRAVAANLRQREWGSRQVAVQIALQASDIKRATAKSLISEAVRNGYLETRIRTNRRGHTYQQIRLRKATP